MGDYWTVSSGIANHTGHTCRECRGTIYVNTPIFVRDGRKIRLFYHKGCFSGDSDPRTQSQSSVLKWEGGLSSKAPPGKGYGKWWTSSYGYVGGGLQNGRTMPSIRQKKASASSTPRHETTAESTTGHEKGPNGSLVLWRSQSLKEGGTSPSSESAILRNGFQRTYSLPDDLAGLDLTPKDVQDRSMRNAGGKQKALGEEGPSSDDSNEQELP